jgi:hypothetical protein
MRTKASLRLPGTWPCTSLAAGQNFSFAGECDIYNGRGKTQIAIGSERYRDLNTKLLMAILLSACPPTQMA